MRNIIVATTNIGKFEEIKSVLKHEFDTFYSLLDFPDHIEVEEDSMFYIENALKKARKIGDRFGFYTIADDSGLEVDALGGRPGVFSSRYGKNDEDRIKRLLNELREVPWNKRRAIFKAYVTCYVPAKEISYVFYGHLKGFIGFEKVGEGGFGYDPVFFVPGLNKYVAELTREEKNRISHRGRALEAFKNFIKGDIFSNSRALNL
ncbi:MAG TPA: RdgB/HAM1 family non-canonical purine NTP pyrophosphatase [Syntrophorhabdaceae bacterium]|jgi:XTP/dITP diphosphohydrolase|nr:RdgB/HAM1 family non-canonical purine NTP pyrophosphatase [Syntrophorhabdaceae bacterium]HOS06338.1 RdgB/HAM1 family non-canonical purine NTP pyrophosphatase [Syntrophorhabdaceae bacterium]HPL40360.1 RdgB/HAM1 family non-canonical purine NTP pyrophosphatase [Syntrophorhabdaceae bacterium]HPN98471.1 RdgB/HAM1 family non-canonical purine NTP pyrophosphatase [Syntrophorhabdaceae bacterium]HQM77023.1 RdgB/HAM1 family non-canonical purine NTP pyrophosphatase [Syntrophorhabdaceae bacterium]